MLQTLSRSIRQKYTHTTSGLEYQKPKTETSSFIVPSTISPLGEHSVTSLESVLSLSLYSGPLKSLIKKEGTPHLTVPFLHSRPLTTLYFVLVLGLSGTYNVSFQT